MTKRKFNLVTVVSVRSGNRYVRTCIYSDGKECIPSTYVDCDTPKTVSEFMAKPDVYCRALDNVVIYYRKRWRIL